MVMEPSPNAGSEEATPCAAPVEIWNNEAAPLLSDTTGESLYRTISRRSDAEYLPADDVDIEASRKQPNGETSPKSIYGTISVLLLGVFLANADQSLILAVYGKIASEFGDLGSGSWLISAFILAQCVAQPLYGKLSDIYGRKVCLQTSYVLFALGTLATGIGQTMSQVIVARALQGVGTTGMTSMVSIIITDLVPLNEVATLRSYVNILQTTGRSCGGVIGGALTQALSWRWAFLVQLPPTIIALILVQWRLHIPSKNNSYETRWQKLKRVDFLGAVSLCITIFAACFVLDTGGQKFPWDSPIITSMAAVGGCSLLAFLGSTKFVAEPIFPLRIISQYPVWTNYLISMLQSTVQISLMLIVPLYFQVTAKSSTAAAGAYLIPAFTGNLLGGLISGYWIKRTGIYKAPTIVGPIVAILAITLCYTTWNGHTSILGSLATLPGGMAVGLVTSSTFVGLAAGVDEKDIAIAGSGMYLFINIGAIAATSAGSAVYQTSLQAALAKALQGVKGGSEIMRQALTDINFVQNVEEDIRRIIVPAFVESFHNVNLLEFGCAALCLGLALCSQQKRLRH